MGDLIDIITQCLSRSRKTKWIRNVIELCPNFQTIYTFFACHIPSGHPFAIVKPHFEVIFCFKYVTFLCNMTMQNVNGPEYPVPVPLQTSSTLIFLLAACFGGQGEITSKNKSPEFVCYGCTSEVRIEDVVSMYFLSGPQWLIACKLAFNLLFWHNGTNPQQIHWTYYPLLRN